MVKVGFICEGRTEQILLSSDRFKLLLQSLNIDPLPIIDAEGSGNLLPHNIAGYLERLENEGAQAIVILTDLDADICITKTKERIAARSKDTVIIAVKAIESWFLAATPAMQAILAQPGFSFHAPEKEPAPFETINKLLIQYKGRGVGSNSAGKVKLITRLLDYGLDISQAATHPFCPSAAYFIQKLAAIGGGNNHD